MVVLDQPRSDRIVEDVRRDVDQIFRFAQRAIEEAPLPETLVAPSPTPDLKAERLPRRDCASEFSGWNDAEQKVNVIRHQAIGIDPDAGFLSNLPQAVEAIQSEIKIREDGRTWRRTDRHGEETPGLAVDVFG